MSGLYTKYHLGYCVGHLQRGQHVDDADADEPAAGLLAARPRHQPDAPHAVHQAHLALPTQPAQNTSTRATTTFVITSKTHAL